MCESDGWLVAWSLYECTWFSLPLCGYSLSVLCNYADDGDTWTKVPAAAEQVRVRSERHNVNVAALCERIQRRELTLEFLAQLSYNPCDDSVMKLTCQHPQLYDLNLGPPDQVVGQAKRCSGWLVVNGRLGACATSNHCLTKVTTSPGECFLTYVAGPIRPLGIGGDKYILVVVDAFTCFLLVMPMRRKAQSASLLAQLFELVRVQFIGKHNNVVRRLHTDKGGELVNCRLQAFHAWRGIVHTFFDTAAHQSNGVAERRIGQLTTGMRSCLLCSCLPNHLWVEAAMHVAHAHDFLPNQTLINCESCVNSKSDNNMMCYCSVVLHPISSVASHTYVYMLYYGDISKEIFHLLVQQMRPFGVNVLFIQAEHPSIT